MPFKKAKPARTLPDRVNPLVQPNLTPERESSSWPVFTPVANNWHPASALIRERRLGQTDLSVRAGAVGTSNATKRENLGLFNYAHLKVPFPESFKGSEIHPHHPKHGPPTSYFLMVRHFSTFLMKHCSPDDNRGEVMMDTLAQAACSKPHSPGPLRPKKRRKRITSSRLNLHQGKRLLAISGSPKRPVCAALSTRLLRT